ncbi:MAG: peptidase C39 bacteriocin processing, partial [Runella slithyformis]
WSVPNIATRVLREQLTEIPLPAVAYLESNGGYFAPIRSVSATNIEWLDTQRGWQNEPLEEFYRKWNHVTLLVEPSANSAENDFATKRKEDFLEQARKPFVLAGLLICVLLLGLVGASHFSQIPWYFVALLLTKTTGVAVSVLLLMQTLGSDNAILRSICGFDSRTNCNNILSSDAAKLWGWLGWSEIGFVYFAGGLIYLLISLTSPLTPSGGTNILSPLWGLGALTLPYTVYSVYYQYFVAKTWCPLCLAVQALFWLEFLIGINWWPSLRFDLSLATVAALGFSFLLPAVLWVFVKKPLQDAAQVWPLRRELQKSKFNPEYVESLFAKQPQMPPIFEDMRVLQMGNSKAENTLTVVTNPVCGPCIRLHPEIEALLQKNDGLRCQFVFTGAGQSMEVAQRLLSLPNEQAIEAMHHWYTSKNKNVAEWLKTVATNPEEARPTQQLNIHAEWCKMAEIVATPTIYLNGRQMPLVYNLSDVENLCRILSVEQYSTPTKDLAESR